MGSNRRAEHTLLAYNTPTVEERLNREKIVYAALELLNESGLKSLTTRRLAERLDVNSASIYWYVKNKDELMQLIADKISADIITSVDSLTWQEKIRQYAENYRQKLLLYRDAVYIFSNTPPVTINRLKLIEEIYSVFVNAGFAYEESALIGNLINNYVIGFVKEEVRFYNVKEEQKEKAEEMITDIQQILLSLPAEEFPTLARIAEYAAVVDMDRQFRYGLDILMEGLEKKRTL